MSAGVSCVDTFGPMDPCPEGAHGRGELGRGREKYQHS